MKNTTVRNKVAKGRRLETLAAASLTADGWSVERKPWSKWASKDFWGCWDILALRYPILKMIQVKTNSCPKSVRDKLAAFKVPAGAQKEIWIYKTKKREWKVVKV